MPMTVLLSSLPESVSTLDVVDCWADGFTKAVPQAAFFPSFDLLSMSKVLQKARSFSRRKRIGDGSTAKRQLSGDNFT